MEANKRVVQDFFAAGNRGDLEACLALMTDDVVWTNIGSTRFSGTYTGKGVLIERLLGPLFQELKAGILSTLDNLIAEGDWVAAQVRGRAETKDGRAYNNTYCHVFRIREGRISEVTEYFDTELTSSVFGTKTG